MWTISTMPLLWAAFQRYTGLFWTWYGACWKHKCFQLSEYFMVVLSKNSNAKRNYEMDEDKTIRKITVGWHALAYLHFVLIPEKVTAPKLQYKSPETFFFFFSKISLLASVCELNTVTTVASLNTKSPVCNWWNKHQVNSF